ncbi:11761_t:CDS:2, partial [Funneliformis geosporum]
EEAMNKNQLQKELLEKIKPGTKPSDLKKTRAKPKPKEVLPSPIEIKDEGCGSDNAPLKPTKQPTSTIPPIVADSIPTPLTAPTGSILALKKQIELHREIKKADEQKKQELAEQKAEYEKTIEALKKPAKNQEQTPTKETKTFLCSDCQQTKSNQELSRQFARVQAQQEKAKPQPSDFICHTCQQTKNEIPNKMKLDFTLQVYLICSLCHPNLKEFNEADLITDDLWAKYPYSSASEILAKEFGIKKEELCDQKQSNQKNIPAFANVDLTSGNYGGFSRQQQLSTQSQEQGQGSRTSNRNSTTAKQNHSNKEYMRANKDANVSTITQDSYELAPVLGKILNAFSFTVIELAKFYPLFDKLMVKLFDESLPYLQRLKILQEKTEKEHKKLPDTSNRKPRIALRLKTLEGCLKAYEPEYLELPPRETFRSRIRGEEEGYTRVIGYQNIIEIVEKYLRSYHFAKRNNTKPPAQLMIMLLGEPGLGKTYISMAIAKALGRGFHMVGMNGKLNASLILGTNIENPGAEPGEVLKAISRREDRGVVICFDEIEKAARECKEAAGIPTDITGNKGFTDTFLDFPTPANECVFIATVNRSQDVPTFVADRFAIRVEVLPLGYEERLEVVRIVLRGELKELDNAFRRIYSKNWEEIFNLFDQEELLKKTLTWTFSIRGAKNNILLKLIPTLVSDFLEEERGLPEVGAYD